MKVIKVITNLFTFISIIVILLALICIFQITVQKKPYANVFGFTIFEIASGSMEPTLKIGDRVVINTTKNINEGDIVVYSDNDTLVCHRIQKINNDEVICKGDNNNMQDSAISKNEIIGKVIHIFPINKT